MNLLTTARRLDGLAQRLVVPGLRAAATICGVKLLTSAELREMAHAGIVSHGEVFYELRDEYGKLSELALVPNLITDVGDAFYAKRAAQISTVPDIFGGMKLGTGTASSAKATPGGSPTVYARIQTYVTGSAAAFVGGYPQGAAGTGYQVTVKSSWAAGTATATGIAEATVSNQNGSGNTPATPSNSSDANDSNTIARAQLSPVVNKGALDTLDITWYHVLLGAP